MPYDCEVIRSIPLCPRSSRDILVWHWDKSGLFTVKSAYHVVEAMRMEKLQVPRPSDAGAGFPWARFWKLAVAPKIKMFLWQALKEFLPCDYNLWRRKMIDNGLCV